MLSQFKQPSLSSHRFTCHQRPFSFSTTWQPHSSPGNSATTVQQRRTHRKRTGSISDASPSGSNFTFFFFPKTQPRAFWHQTGKPCTRATGVQESPTTSFIYVAVCAKLSVSCSLSVQNYCIWQTLATVYPPLPNTRVYISCQKQSLHR